MIEAHINLLSCNLVLRIFCRTAIGRARVSQVDEAVTVGTNRELANVQETTVSQPMQSPNLQALAGENPNLPNVNVPMNPLSAQMNPTYYRAGSANQFLTPLLRPGKSDIVWNGMELLDRLATPPQQYTQGARLLNGPIGFPKQPQAETKYPSPYYQPEPKPMFDRDPWYLPQQEIVQP